MKVTIENLNNRLRLRWVCPETGRRRTLALGVQEGNTGRAVAAKLKALIENDAANGYYDPSLVKYLPPKKRQGITGITTVELFDRFTQYQQKHAGLSKASIDTRYKYLKVMLEKHLNIKVTDIDRAAIDAFTLACRKIKPDTAKQRIWLLKAAWSWGRDKFQLPALNPWDGVSERFKSVPVQPVPGFSKVEVRRILDGFRNSLHYASYFEYVRFRLSMANRPQELRDLRWKHAADDFSSVWFVSNKTKKARTVTLDPSIASMLKNRRDRLKPASDDELVFTSREGFPVDNGNFRRLWRIVLAEVGVPYRKPYTTRKTCVRNSLLSGGNYIEVAAAAGHDPHTMHKYYGDAIQQASVLKAFE